MYYILRCPAPIDDGYGYIEIEDWIGILGFGDWSWGAIGQERPTGPVEIAAVPHDGYRGPPHELRDSNVPLLSARLRAALDRAAVDNVFYHPVTLKNPETAETYEY